MSRARPDRPKDCPYVGKGGLKLAFALDAFGIAVAGRTAADFGCHVGGFTDCLLRRGAARVFAVDTAYGTLAWTLRNDPRVTVFERTSILDWAPPAPLGFVAADVGWTRQALSLAAVARALAPGGEALSLVKPQYEAPRHLLVRGVLPPERLPEVLEAVRAACPPSLVIAGEARSPLPGSGGNLEHWLHLRAAPAPATEKTPAVG
ncbi:MAG: TlyA family rRNA (cytidine-2'-O)-methyltransferase [Planctomycetes bacterium]|jgi:23S rRNA (cytidine1920-2'-O)/16S rRNA (cytidine1409-2'-O)-methyltransferase|nr:TlyA family rRNA (cytidine-2'-O)-methyltransferase [Planctomycetota bacterium]